MIVDGLLFYSGLGFLLKLYTIPKIVKVQNKTPASDNAFLFCRGEAPSSSNKNLAYNSKQSLKINSNIITST